MVLFEIFISYGMAGLLLIALISSIIPIPTEPVVFGLLDVGKKPEIVLLILIIGSIAGAYIGYLLGKYKIRKIIPFHDRKKELMMQLYFRKYGAFLLIISPWIPIVGDLAPMVAGVENYETKRFMVVISIAKTIKSIGIIYLSIKIIDLWSLFPK
ncbi:MAG: DedA family protein [Candidatus Methanoperedens sp.]|nr:DedA family protein [Candidatus Methanoperedens sp.]